MPDTLFVIVILLNDYKMVYNRGIEIVGCRTVTKTIYDNTKRTDAGHTTRDTKSNH